MKPIRRRPAPSAWTGTARSVARRRAHRGIGFGGAMILAVLVIFFVKASIAVLLPTPASCRSAPSWTS
jgi:hypothetical protein